MPSEYTLDEIRRFKPVHITEVKLNIYHLSLLSPING